MKSGVLFRIVRILGKAIIVLFALGTLGSFFPAIPLLGEIGPVLTSAIGPWLTIVSLIGAVWIFLRWRKARRTTTLVLAGLAAFATTGSAIILARQVGVARDNGASIDPVQMLLAHSQADADPPPETVIYSEFDGQQLPLDIYRPTGNARTGLAPIFVYRPPRTIAILG